MNAAGRLDWALFLALKAMPVSLCSAVGAALSPAARLTHAAAHRDAKTLFAALRLDWANDPAALEAAVRRLWACTGRTYAEFAISHRLVRSGRVAIENVETIDRAMASGRPVIVIFVHTGNWELSGMQLAYRYPGRGVAIFDPPKQESRAAIVWSVRRQMPVDLIPMSRMIWRHALTRLRQPGGVLWVPADEFNGRVAAPFFGRPLRIDGNLGKIARLALRTGAIVVPFYGERHPGLRFTTHVLEPLTFSGTPDDDYAVLAAVQAMDAALTPAVIRMLDQWYMALMYRDYASAG